MTRPGSYLLIGSVGIALAFTGTVLAHVDYATTGADVNLALHWTTLRQAATALHPQVARLAFVFLLVGFGTKAGLVPTHTWLPDAHSEAPSSLSAMMSGVLLAVALARSCAGKRSSISRSARRSATRF